jgi:hypothetical protein
MRRRVVLSRRCGWRCTARPRPPSTASGPVTPTPSANATLGSYAGRPTSSAGLDHWFAVFGRFQFSLGEKPQINSCAGHRVPRSSAGSRSLPVPQPARSCYRSDSPSICPVTHPPRHLQRMPGTCSCRPAAHQPDGLPIRTSGGCFFDDVTRRHTFDGVQCLQLSRNG